MTTPWASPPACSLSGPICNHFFFFFFFFFVGAVVSEGTRDSGGVDIVPTFPHNNIARGMNFPPLSQARVLLSYHPFFVYFFAVSVSSYTTRGVRSELADGILVVASVAGPQPLATVMKGHGSSHGAFFHYHRGRAIRMHRPEVLPSSTCVHFWFPRNG